MSGAKVYSGKDKRDTCSTGNPADDGSGGTIVTADAMNCQKGTAEAVINAGGDYVLALKVTSSFSMKR